MTLNRSDLPLQARSCRCGRPLDVLGHHRAACANAGVLGCRGWVLENVAARVCREAGGRVRTNLAVRDMDLGAHVQLDGRRLEIVVEGLPLWGGSQLALDTTMVCPLSRDGVAQRGTATTDGKSLARARRRKERTYPELIGEHGRARFVVLGVGGRWSAETNVFLRSLAAAKGAPLWLGEQVRAAWLRKWQGLLGCAAARSFSCSLLDGPVASGADGAIPSMSTVLSEARYSYEFGC